MVFESKYKKKECCPHCLFEDIKNATKVAELHRHLQSFHQRELRVRRINLEIEELEGSKETASTERDLKKFHREKNQTYRLITYEGQYKYNIAVSKQYIETNRFIDKLM